VGARLARRVCPENGQHHGGDPAQVPYWPDSDYDTILVFKITNDAGKKSFSFTIEHEGLNNLSDKCS
jgi:hypothetical protein